MLNPMIFAGDRPLSKEGKLPVHLQVSLIRKTSIIIPLEEIPRGSLARVVGSDLSDGERSSALGWAKKSGGSLVLDQHPFRTLAEWKSDTTRYIPIAELPGLLMLTAQYGLVSIGKEMHGCRSVRPGSVPTGRFLASVEEILG